MKLYKKTYIYDKQELILYDELCILADFFKKFFQEYHQNVKQFASRPGLMFCWAWSGSKLFAKVF